MFVCFVFKAISTFGLGFPSGSVVKNAPGVQEMQEMQVQSLGLEEGMATHSSIFA